MPLTDDERQLWHSFKSQSDQSAFLALYELYAPWSRVVAREVFRRIRVRDLEWCDYVQNASIGLLEAMSRYDISREVDFMAYAKPRVRGAVFNGLRPSLSQVNKQTFHVDWYADRASSISGSESTDSLDGLISQVTSLAIGMLLDFNSEYDTHSHITDPLRNAERMQYDSMLMESIGVLSKNERFVIEAHYFQYMSFVDIAEVLCLTKGRISQIHSAALVKMRNSVRTLVATKPESV
jgi:RNA polymerase sigma factor for flagellar operon FliA